ncbi:MAG: c-type cytochrome biogenesis protein CcmI [Pseudomonadota bacterium]
MTLTFWLVAILMSALAAAFVLLPMFLSRRGDNAEDRTRVNVEIFSERLAELDVQLADEVITPEEFADLKAELEKNLLSETRSGYQVRAGKRDAGRLPYALALLIPLFAIFAYAEFGLNWGALADLEIASSLRGATPGQQSGGQPHDSGSFDASVARLAERLQSQPDNDEGWFLLAQSYMNLELYERASGAFRHLLDRYPTDPDLATYYAEALFLADGRQISPRVDAAIKQTLALDPGNITMLEIRGMDAFARGELAEARASFTRALASNPEPARASLLEQAIARIDTMPGAPQVTESPAGMQAEGARVQQQNPGQALAATGETGSGQTRSGETRSLNVLVEVGDTVDVGMDTPVFVFARAVTGPPMPLAVARLSRRDLPTLVQLDESMAMMPGMGLANFDQVQVVARISMSGIANAGPDDFEARSAAIDLSTPNPVIKLRVDSRIRDL